MSRTLRLASTLLLGIAAAAWCVPARALRPYDGTDAAVAPASEVELEFGYFGYMREGPQRSLLAPAVVLNVGLENGAELVIEGRVRNRINPDLGLSGQSLEGAAVSLKQVHRIGILQDASGPSVASECGVLLPTQTGESYGASCAGITSVRWYDITTHLNTALARNRNQHGEVFAGVIVEGPLISNVRPVLETYLMHDSAGERVESALIGLLWPARDNLSFDIALRRARDHGNGITELRAGFTWTQPARH